MYRKEYIVHIVKLKRDMRANSFVKIHFSVLYKSEVPSFYRVCFIVYDIIIRYDVMLFYIYKQ
jgi:hypothetical protein